MTREKVKVKDNGYGAAVHILEDEIGPYGIVQVEQKEVTVENKRLKWGLRKAEVVGSIDALFYMNYQAGESLPGHIVTKEQTEPLFEDDPEIGLYWKNNIVVRYQGQPVYRYMYYTEDPHDVDILLTATIEIQK